MTDALRTVTQLPKELAAEWRSGRPSPIRLATLLPQIHAHSPATYDREWRPALDRLDLPPLTVDTVQRCFSLAPLLPERAHLEVDVDDEVEHERILELLSSPLGERISRLTIRGLFAGHEATKAIFDHPGLGQIRSLRLGGGDDWENDIVDRLASSNLHLESLGFITSSGLTNDHLRALAAVKSLHRLKTFRIERAEWMQESARAVSDAGIAALVGGLREVVFLDLAGCTEIGEEALTHIATLPCLRALGVSGGVAPDPCPWLTKLMARLTHLAVTDAKASVVSLMRGPTPLVFLDLTRNDLDAEGVAPIARTDALSALRHLRLVDEIDWSISDQEGIHSPINPLHFDELEALRASTHLPHLEQIDCLDADDYPTAYCTRDRGGWEPDPELWSAYEPWTLTEHRRI